MSDVLTAGTLPATPLAGTTPNPVYFYDFTWIDVPTSDPATAASMINPLGAQGYNLAWVLPAPWQGGQPYARVWLQRAKYSP